MRARLILLLLPFLNFAQSRFIDSLKLVLKEAKHDTTRCIALNELAETIDDIAVWPLYNEQLLRLAEKNKNAPPPLKKFYLKQMANALNNIGYLAQQQGNVPKALEFYQKSLKIDIELKDKMGVATSLNNLGYIYFNQGDVLNALEHHHKSLKLREEINDRKGIAQSLNNLAVLYNNQGEFSKALEYYLRSLKLEEEINNKEGAAVCLINIGFLYKSLGNLPKAMEYFEKSLKINGEINNKDGAANSLMNIGGVLAIRSDYGGALAYYKKSLAIREEMNDEVGIINPLTNIGQMLMLEGKTEEALVYTTRSFIAAKKLGYPENIENAAKVLKAIYIKQNNYKGALAMFELFTLMRDSVNNAETKKESVKKEMQYAYEKKAAADSVKNAETQKVKDAQLAAQTASLKQEKFQRYSLIAGLLIVLGGLGFVINRFRVTQKQKKIIEQQKIIVDEAFDKLHEKNKEVMDSIYYARRIQRALITSEKYIDRVLKSKTK
ncbi:MAG: tetratricopeptide repeat protein [Bacteroidia bacterium]|nr:tetratricopeptide repeat protein [Bacteroidia bacterium]